jgi:AraC-like DNA-binding protein
MCCETLQDAILLNARYQPINQSAGKTDLFCDSAYAVMRWQCNTPDHEWMRPLTEAVFAGYARLGRWLTWRDLQPIRSMKFMHNPPADISAYQMTFDCPLHFAADENAMRFDADFLSTRLQQHDPYMLTLLTDRLDKQIALLGSRASLQTDIIKLLDRHPQKLPTLTQIADLLNLSERTIKRRLQTESTSFSRLIEEHRKQRALYFLTQTPITVADLAEQLGYREPCSFQRAFKQWFGKTPGEYRQHSRHHLGSVQTLLTTLASTSP